MSDKQRAAIIAGDIITPRWRDNLLDWIVIDNNGNHYVIYINRGEMFVVVSADTHEEKYGPMQKVCLASMKHGIIDAIATVGSWGYNWKHVFYAERRIKESFV
jgi:hypothetical protein